MTVLVRAAALIAAAFAAVPVYSHDFPLNTGNGLLAACDYQGSDREEVEFHFGSCIGFIKGVSNWYSISTSWMDKSDRLPELCARESMDNQQIRDVVVKELKANPEGRDGSSALIVVTALLKAFPCHTGRGG